MIEMFNIIEKNINIKFNINISEVLNYNNVKDYITNILFDTLSQICQIELSGGTFSWSN